jgi:hypothetical protein
MFGINFICYQRERDREREKERESHNLKTFFQLHFCDHNNDKAMISSNNYKTDQTHSIYFNVFF